MELFKIVKDTNPNLRKRCEQVEMPVSDEIKQTLYDMIEYLKLSQDEEFTASHPSVKPGVGLAAPQIGINKQMLAIYYQDEEGKYHEFALVNPRIISESVKQAYLENGEGCLSVEKEHPGYVYRAYKVTVRAYDALQDKIIEHTFIGFPSMIVQHEIDHLKGVLFYDHIDKKNPFKQINGSVAL